MDPTTFIFFVLTALALIGLWSRHWSLTSRVSRIEVQIARFISDIESEKGTRRRTNHDLVNRIRVLEGQKPIPNYDCAQD